jgi:release factor glutamine methyltransferase
MNWSVHPASELDVVIAALRRSGCVAAEEEAVELMAAADGDPVRLAALVRRRSDGEPLAWLVGSVQFCDHRVLVHSGVYVPRWQSEPLALAATDRLPEDGTAVDLCTGTGAVALVLGRRRPRARVVATEIDPVATACARANGITVFEGDLTEPLPVGLSGQVDVVVAIVPYVPTDELHLLPRDVTAYEPRGALDGGPGGLEFLRRVVVESVSLLRRGGWLLLELGGNEGELLTPLLERHGYHDVEFLTDEDGDLRGISAQH